MAFGKKVTTTFTLTAENSWAPLACIVIFYTSETGEVVNDVLAIPVQPVFENKVGY